MFGPDKNGGGQHAFAKGHGKIDMLDKNLEVDPKQKTNDSKAKADDGKPPYTLHAIWKDNLISVKDRDGDKVYDLLTLTGDAAFIHYYYETKPLGVSLIELPTGARVSLHYSSGTESVKRSGLAVVP